MLKVIETNISLGNNDEIMDTQSRVIETESWNNYKEEILTLKRIATNDALGNVNGYNIPIDSYIEKVIANDDGHLVVKFVKIADDGLKSIKSSYLIDEGDK